jgi:hypothetical protein
MCIVSKTILGYIPKANVGNNKDIKEINSILEISFIGLRCGE